MQGAMCLWLSCVLASSPGVRLRHPQVMPAGEAVVLCGRNRDACRLAPVVLPPAVLQAAAPAPMPAAAPPALAVPTTAASGTADGGVAVADPSVLVGQAAHASPAAEDKPSTAVAAPPAEAKPAPQHPPMPQQPPQQPPPPPQQPQLISEIVSLEAADAAGAGPGAIIFVHPELAELEALAQRLEADESAALHGESDVQMRRQR